MGVDACASLPKLQSVLQQIHMGRLGNIRTQLDDGKEERVKILALCPQALRGHRRYKKSMPSEEKAHFTLCALT